MNLDFLVSAFESLGTWISGLLEGASFNFDFIKELFDFLGGFFS